MSSEPAFSIEKDSCWTATLQNFLEIAENSFYAGHSRFFGVFLRETRFLLRMGATGCSIRGEKFCRRLDSEICCCILVIDAIVQVRVVSIRKACLMQITIDHGSERAVYQQIMDQVKRDIALGRLKTGQRLPTVRELSAGLVINPNTIAKAYRQLEQDGIIVTRAGAGAFVAELSSNLSRTVRRRILHEQLELLVVEAIHMQIDAETLREWFENTLKRFRFDGKGQTDE